jgi:uncharacterized protein YbjT (DUF2867 family)
MRIAVVGGTGLAGRQTVDAILRKGHETIVIARSHGVDVLTGEGLDAALAGVDAVIDVMNTRPADVEATRENFDTATRHLLAAEQRAHVQHHVLLSIVGIDRVQDNAHYAGKRAQEARVSTGAVPWTIQRVTQFHEFAGMLVGWVKRGDVAELPPLQLQPVAVSDVAEVLVELATGKPRGRAIDLAGPEKLGLLDLARRTLAARGESTRVLANEGSNLLGAEASGDALLPGPGARLGPTTFDAWLDRQGPGSRIPS